MVYQFKSKKCLNSRLGMTDKTNVLLIYFLQYDSIILVGISIGAIVC